MDPQKEQQKTIKKEKEQVSDDYLKIDCRMYENVFPRKDDLVMV